MKNSKNKSKWPDWMSTTAKKKFIEMVRRIREYEKVNGPIYMKKVFIIVFTHYHKLSLVSETTTIHPFAFTTEQAAKDYLSFAALLGDTTAEVVELELKEKQNVVLQTMQSSEEDRKRNIESSQLDTGTICSSKEISETA